MDSFICGSCTLIFHEVGEFLEHKKMCMIQASHKVASQRVEAMKSVEATVLDSSGNSTTFLIIRADADNEVRFDTGCKGTADRLTSMNYQHSQSMSSCSGECMTSTSGIVTEDVPESLDPNSSSSEPVTQPAAGGKQCDGKTSTLQPARKRGRPRKSENKNSTCLAAAETTLLAPEENGDGRYTCQHCLRLFTKLRQFTSHVCLGITESDNAAALLLTSGAGTVHSNDVGSLDSNAVMGDGRHGVVSRIQDHSDRVVSSSSIAVGLLRERVVESLSSTANNSSDAPRRHRRHRMPVFQRDADRRLFNTCLEVDIVPLVQGMYKQSVTEADCRTKIARGGTSKLFTCLTCNKVFTSVSHCQQHCLVHTTARPFHCPWCSYATNARGNLYTHARQHTGMVFHCSQCRFQTGNRSHLVEHELTHASQPPQSCELCCRHFKTLKSLMNHTRKYHARNSTGLSYLSRLQGSCKQLKIYANMTDLDTMCKKNYSPKKAAGCNKAVISSACDADESLPKDGVICRLCSQKCDNLESYVRSHWMSHQFIYFCSVCFAVFPSSLRLVKHLDTSHSLTSSDSVLVPADTVWQSIALSVFLAPADIAAASCLTDITAAVCDESLEDNVVTDVLQGMEYCSLVLGYSDSEILVCISDPCHDTDIELAESSSFKVPSITRTACLNVGYKPMSPDVFSLLRQTLGCSECECCGRLHLVQSDLDRHAPCHTGDPVLRCGHCDHVACTFDELCSHMQQVHEQKTYMCDICGSRAATDAQLWTHRRKTHAAATVHYRCQLCQLTFVSLKRLRVHLGAKHRELSCNQLTGQLMAFQAQRKNTGRRAHTCPYCGRVFRKASSDLRKHMWVHEGIKPFLCLLCQYACRSRSNLAEHMRRHSAHKPFLCNCCGKAYKSRTALRCHERSHVDGRLFKCDKIQANRYLRQWSMVSYSVRWGNDLLKDERYRDPKCSYEAVQLSHLQRHLETHQVQKQFACSHCDYSANTARYVKIHQTRRHPRILTLTVTQRQVAGTSFQCTVCQYHFGNASDLKRHVKLRHSSRLV